MTTPTNRDRAAGWQAFAWIGVFVTIIWSGYWFATPLESGFWRLIRDGIRTDLESQGTQALLVAVMTFNILVMLRLKWRNLGCWTDATPDFLLALLLFVTVGRYFSDVQTSAGWQSFPVRGGGTAVLNHGAFALVAGCFTSVLVSLMIHRCGDSIHERKERAYTSVWFGLFGALLLTSIYHPDWSNFWIQFEYRDSARWTGPMIICNEFGLLMGCALMMAFGNLLTLLKRLTVEWRDRISGKASSPNLRLRVVLAINVLMLIWLVVPLMLSYSRGAWLGTLAGGVYMSVSLSRSGAWPRIRSRAVPLACLLAGLSLVSFWTFRHSELPVLRRVFSVANLNDFSILNRLSSYEHGLSMMGTKPLAGYGWNGVETAYEGLYMPPRLQEGMAILNNDFIHLGTAIGLPALLCLATILMLKLFPPAMTANNRATANQGLRTATDWRMVSCRAGCIVLLFGFLFDGALLKLTLAIPFWALLELGVAQDRSHEKATGLAAASGNRLSTWLPFSRIAVGSVFIAVIGFIGTIVWAKCRDPFQRHELSLRLPDSGLTDVITVTSKQAKRHPVALYFDSGDEKAYASGASLRLLSELGFAAVSLKRAALSTENASEILPALTEALKTQAWAEASSACWIGEGVAGEQLLTLALTQSNQPPKLVVLTEASPAHLSQIAARAVGVTNLDLPFLLLVVSGEETDFVRRQIEHVAAQLRSIGMKMDIRAVAYDQKTKLSKNRLIAEFCADFLSIGDAERTKNTSKAWIYWMLAGFYLIVLFLGILFLRNSKTAEPNQALTRSHRLLWAMASIALVVGLVQTAVQVLLPRRAVSLQSVESAQRWIVWKGIENDFSRLAMLPVWKDSSVGDIIEHADLANFRKPFLYDGLNNEIRFNYVVSPQIAEESNSGADWRRLLWLNFYPRVRKMTDPVSASKATVAFLRERVSINAMGQKKQSIGSMWKSQSADEEGWERLYIAALRSATVAARLDENAKAEIWNGKTWESAPRPVMFRQDRAKTE